jgi:hypothetical protein
MGRESKRATVTASVITCPPEALLATRYPTVPEMGTNAGRSIKKTTIWRPLAPRRGGLAKYSQCGWCCCDAASSLGEGMIGRAAPTQFAAVGRETAEQRPAKPNRAGGKVT